MIGYCSVLLGQSLLSAALLAIWPSRWHNQLKPLSYALVFISVLLVMAMFYHFDITNPGFQFLERYSWIAPLGIDYYVGVDGLSLLLIGLTVFANVLVVLSQTCLLTFAARTYLALFFFMQAVTVGVFMALDGVLFYLFWESTLLPMYLALGIWGSADKLYASRKFFIFTFTGSLLLLLAVVYLGLMAGSFAFDKWYVLALNWTEQCLLFLMFSAAFAVKLPMFPLHVWLPDAHTEAPAAGSLILAALLLKVGAYGFLRFNLPVTPDAAMFFAWYMVAISVFAVIYIGLLALIQQDIKRLIAYASISHMGMVTLGFFMIYLIAHKDYLALQMALSGACIQMICHAFSAGGLFLAFGMLYTRYAKRQIADYSGLAHSMPVFTVFFVLFALSNIGLPATAGFVGEYLIFLSSFYVSPLLSFFALFSILLSAAYTLWMIKRVFYGPITAVELAKVEDLNKDEILPLALLAFAVLLVGLYPNILLRYLLLPVNKIISLSLTSKFV